MPDLVTDGDNLGDHLATRSFKTIKGSDIASSTNITIGTSGNTFDVTGTTTIQHFDNANWAVGSVVSLHFDGALILTNNAGSLSGAKCNILLTGDTNYTTKAGDIITFLLHESTSWQEISRNSVASIPDNSISNAKLMAGIDAVKLADGSVTNSELKYINTLSDNAQNQLNLKSTIASPTFTGTVVLPNVPAIVTTQLNLKSPIASPTFTGDVTTASAKFVNAGIAGLGALSIQNQADNAISQVIVRPTGTGTRSQITTANSSDPTINAELLTIGSDIYGTNENAIRTYSSGTGTTRPLAFYYDTTKVMEISSSGVAVPATLNLSGNNLDNIKNLHHNISSGSLTIDFSTDQLQTLTITNNSTFATPSNMATGKSKTYKLNNSSGSSTYTFTFPAWKFVGTKPTDIAPTKTGILTLTCFGTSNTDIVAGYAVEE